ncbi:MAG: sugar ABC transporter permease [Erysipelotrichaceae bacterium]|nr:sugar ABC transporter permease [Erysipelotrichaceae bacterium]
MLRYKTKNDEVITPKTFLKPTLYLLPFMIGVLIFTVYPFFNAILISFKEDFRVMTDEFSGYGLGNYAHILSDSTFISSIYNTIIYVVVVVSISLIISLFIAVMLNNIKRLQGLYQTAYFMPIVTSSAAIGLVWRWIFNYDYGILNYILSIFGQDAINWLNNPKYSLVCLCIYGIWSMLPMTIILLLSGLQNIDPQYYTAAKVDGAKSKDIFTNITVPLLAPTIGLVAIINMISAFKVFEGLYVLFGGKPGPAYNLYTVIFYLYDQFYTKFKVGYAAASAIILFLIILVFTVLQNKIQKKYDYY